MSECRCPGAEALATEVTQVLQYLMSELNKKDILFLDKLIMEKKQYEAYT